MGAGVPGKGAPRRPARGPDRPRPRHPSPRSAMEKGKLHKLGKDSSKRGRQVSGTRGRDDRGGDPWEPPGRARAGTGD